MKNVPTTISRITQEFQNVGKEAAKSAGKAVMDVLNPMNLPKEVLGPTFNQEANQSPESLDGKNATPLDTSALERKHRENDQKKSDQEKLLAIRQQFNLVKKEETKAREDLKKEEYERLKKEQEELAAAREKQQDMAVEAPPDPTGKTPIGIMKRQQQQRVTERKPNSGKQ